MAEVTPAVARQPRRPEMVRARFDRLLAKTPPLEPLPGVQPLNPGHFLLERIRTRARPKLRAAKRVKMRGRRK